MKHSWIFMSHNESNHPIYWCKNCGCLKADSTSPIGQLLFLYAVHKPSNSITTWSTKLPECVDEAENN